MRLLLAFTLILALALSASAQPEPIPPPRAPGPFPALPDDEAWGKLPPRKTPLPEWARVLAGPLPKTTAKMLELDYLHREKNPLGARFAAHIRRTVASELGSEYGVAVAVDDLLRLGKLDKMSVAEHDALAFVKKLTLTASEITDDEFKELLNNFTPEQVTAIVHTVAYANFHNRIILALGVKGESPVAEPLALKFDLDAAKVKAPDRPPWDDLKEVKADGLSVRVEWGKDGFDELNKAVEKQKDRKPRMPLPDKSTFEKFPPREKDQAQKIVWMTVSAGYQPEMTRAWFAVLYTFYEEAKVDRVFTNSVFWVVTRTNDCFY